MAESDTQTPPSSGSPVESGSDDAWSRMRAGFALPSYADRPGIRRNIDWHTRHPDYVLKVTARAEPYLLFILQGLERRGMPAELALLPAVESAYLPRARSRHGAAGLWQFIPDTGRRVGLKQNWWYDARRDVIASTGAALTYLSSLNRQFDGDWLLTLAAYNAGPSRVSRAIRRNRKLGRPTDFWSLDLPAETRAYVPKLLALKEIVSDADGHGVKLWPIAGEPYLASVELQRQIDLARAARLAGLGREEFLDLNPGYSRWATDPEGPHRLVLPIDRVDRFERNLAQIPQDEWVTWYRHRIARGETLSHIARRYGTSVTHIRKVNGLKGTRIRAGSHLLVPRAAAGHAPSASPVMSAGAARPASTGRRLTHTVARGESLWTISRQYRVSVRALARWNDRSTRDILHVGERLTVWVAPDATDSRSARAATGKGVPT